jgi:RNA-directed DNA polymerase
VGFVRYADDTLIWSHTYSEITEAVDALHAASATIGSKINLLKSEGVRLLVPEGTREVEMRSTDTVSYLGHELSLRKISLKPGSVQRLKVRIEQLLFANLLREPLNGAQDLRRLTDLDRDYATFIWQLRRYLYGPLSEVQVRRFQRGGMPPMTFQGAMSYFPLVNDEMQLRQFDSWLASRTWLAVRKRQHLLSSLTPRRPLPWSMSRPDLIGLMTSSGTTGAPVDLRLPSLSRIARAIQIAVETHGLAVVSAADDPYLYAD